MNFKTSCKTREAPASKAAVSRQYEVATRLQLRPSRNKSLRNIVLLLWLAASQVELFVNRMDVAMARRYSRSASKDVASAMRKRKRGTLRSGRSRKKVKGRKQAIAIGLSEARRKGKKVPKKRKRKQSRSA